MNSAVAPTLARRSDRPLGKLSRKHHDGCAPHELTVCRPRVGQESKAAVRHANAIDIWHRPQRVTPRPDDSDEAAA
jgi:hypothetical protein